MRETEEDRILMSLNLYIHSGHHVWPPRTSGKQWKVLWVGWSGPRRLDEDSQRQYKDESVVALICGPRTHLQLEVSERTLKDPGLLSDWWAKSDSWERPPLILRFLWQWALLIALEFTWLFKAKNITLSCRFYNVCRCNTYDNSSIKDGGRGQWFLHFTWNSN